MIPFLLSFAIITGIIYSRLDNSLSHRKQYIWMVTILLIAQSSLRGLSVGSDTFGYYNYFMDIKHTSWGEIGELIIDRYVHWNSTEDIGFLVFNKIIYSFTGNFNVFLFVSSLFFFIPFIILLERYSKDIMQLIFIFVLYICLFDAVAMSGVRKEIALGMSMLSLIFYSDGKYLWMLIAFFVGFFIHMSILLVLLFPALDKLNVNKLRILHILALMLIFVVISFSSQIIIGMGNFVENEHYANYGMSDASGYDAIIFVVCIEIISLFCLIAYRSCDFIDERFMKLMYASLPCFTFFAPLITHNGSMIRISQYFHIYILLLLPFAIERFFQNRVLVYTALIIALIVMSSISGYREYFFFWNDPMNLRMLNNYF